jgi:hypothetical protein
MTKIKDTPWDASAFGLHTAEVIEYSVAGLQQASETPGHYTLKVDPLADKRLLQQYGFYYCDTLIEPFCTADKLKKISHPQAKISREVAWPDLLAICHGAFTHGRFHRDFNLEKSSADQRYDNWLHQLYEKNSVYGLFWDEQPAGFIAFSNNNLVLHAVAEAHRGQGRAKYWWSAVCTELLTEGHSEVSSSISAANLAILNLYSSLGFSFRNALDVYHGLVQAEPLQSK